LVITDPAASSTAPEWEREERVRGDAEEGEGAAPGASWRRLPQQQADTWSGLGAALAIALVLTLRRRR